jgi:carbon-monoxide dehydrogenase small subunit
MSKSKEIALLVNESIFKVKINEEENLLTTLRGAGFFSVKFGCGTGDCGMCTVLIEGKPTLSCQTKTVAIE